MLRGTISTRILVALAAVAVTGTALAFALQEARASEKRAKGWLGVSVQELTPSLRERMKLGDQTGLLVTMVERDSPADEAGLREDDVIVEFAGNKVEMSRDFMRMVRNAGADQKVKIAYVRKGERKSTEAILGKRQRDTGASVRAFSWGGPAGVMSFHSRPRLGVQVHELDENLAAYFKVDPRGGVLVLSVTPDSPAEKAGLKSGDVLTKIDNAEVRDPEDLIEALQEFEEGETVKIEYVRQGRRQSAQAELEEPSSRGYRFRVPGVERFHLERVPFGTEQEAVIELPDEGWREIGRERRHDDLRRALHLKPPVLIETI